MIPHFIYERPGIAAGTDLNDNFIQAYLIRLDHDLVAQNVVEIIQDIIHRRRIERGSFVFDHLLFSSEHRSQPHGVPSAWAGLVMGFYDIPGFKS